MTEMDIHERRARLLMAMVDGGETRIEPTAPDDGVGVAWIRMHDAIVIALAAADRENAKLRGELAGIPSSPDYSGAESCCWSAKHHAIHLLAAERDDLRAQLAAAQAQLAVLSAAPQPEPAPSTQKPMVKCIYTTSGWHRPGVCCASDEPARWRNGPSCRQPFCDHESCAGAERDFHVAPEPPASDEPARTPDLMAALRATVEAAKKRRTAPKDES